jgi:hypothetical protein
MMMKYIKLWYADNDSENNIRKHLRNDPEVKDVYVVRLLIQSKLRSEENPRVLLPASIRV